MAAPVVIPESFRLTFRGEVILPTDGEAYERARHVHNGNIDKRPGVIFMCAGSSDVARAVRLARALKLAIGVRGQGHAADGGGAGEDGQALICLSRMRSVHVDGAARVARVDGGCTLGDVEQETSEFGLVASHGIAPPTGVGGLYGHGGFGYLTHLYGLSADNVVGAQVVLADGRIVEATPLNEYADLLWGVRGAASSFGVVTRFDVRLHPVRPLVGGLWAFVCESLEEQIKAITAARDAINAVETRGDASVDHRIFGSVVVASLPPPHPHGGKACVLMQLGAWVPAGATEQDALKRLQPFVQMAERNGGIVLGAAPAPMPFHVFNSLLLPLVTSYPPGIRGYWKGLLLLRDDFDDAMVRLLVEQWARRLMPAMGSSLLTIELHGGAHGRAAGQRAGLTTFEDNGETLDIPAAHVRDFDYSAGLIGTYLGAENDDAVRDFVRGIYDAALQKVHGRSPVYSNYFNDLDTRSGYKARPFGNDPRVMRRLRTLKAKYDPQCVFCRRTMLIDSNAQEE